MSFQRDKLNDSLKESERLIRRLDRLLKRNVAKRKRINRSITDTRKRLARAVDSLNETKRALEACE